MRALEPTRWIVIAILLAPLPLRAQESDTGRIAGRVAACGAFAGAAALSADILAEDLSGFIVGMALAFTLGSTSRYCLYGRDPTPPRLYDRICDSTMDYVPLLGLIPYRSLGGDIDDEPATALALGAFGLLAGVGKEKGCKEPGGPRLSPRFVEGVLRPDPDAGGARWSSGRP